MQFYVMGDADSKQAFFVINDDEQPLAFANEADAVASAKDYCTDMLIMKVVGKATQRTSHRYEKVK